MATPRPFPDRRERLFGRERDLEALSARVRFKGLTAVAARPQMGKSWLLTELARRLSQDHEPRHLVGFERYGHASDLLLRAVQDLYQRWLADASYRDQALKVWRDEKPNLLPGFAKTLANLLTDLPFLDAIKKAIDDLIAADQKLKTGGLQLQTLSYEQARDLVGAVAEISARPIALFLDQWERAAEVEREARTLDAFVRHPEEWPHCHVFLALLLDKPAYGMVQELEAGRPGPARIYALEPMQLGVPNEQARLVRYVQREVAPAARVEEETLLELIDGFPGVIMRWTDTSQGEHMHTRADLERVAAEAHAYRFSEFNRILKPLAGELQRLAIRIALLPGGGGPVWAAIKADVLEALNAGLIDDLCIANVLESKSGEPPSFGHPKREEMARAWFVEHRGEGVRVEAAALILRLAAAIRDVTPAVEPNAIVLLRLLPLARDLSLGNLPLALCQAAASLFEALEEVDDALLLGAKEAHTQKFKAAVPLLAMGLLNTLNHAKDEQDLARRDGLLAELRGLAEAHPEDAAVRERLAMGLFNTLVDAKDEQELARRDGLLAELRALAQAHPEDAAVRQPLAMGLAKTMLDAAEAEEPELEAALRTELLALAEAHPQDGWLEQFRSAGLL